MCNVSSIEKVFTFAFYIRISYIIAGSKSILLEQPHYLTAFINQQTLVMKKIYFLSLFFIALSVQSVKAQCPTPTGMVGVPLSLNGVCFINIQFAIPNSNVSIYNASGYVAQGTANASGNAVIPYPCGSNPITSILSVVTTPAFQSCNNSIISQPISLPIKLISFTATLTANKTVVLKWQTAWELNNDKYEVERSTDGVNYTKLSTTNSNGNSFDQQAYSFEDASFLVGTLAFYRLKQTDLDGKSSYSKIAYVNDKSSLTSDYTLFPNPLNGGNNTIQIKGIASSEVTYSNIHIADLTGRTISYKIIGANAIELNAAAPSGVYILQVKDKTLKLIKN